LFEKDIIPTTSPFGYSSFQKEESSMRPREPGSGASPDSPPARGGAPRRGEVVGVFQKEGAPERRGSRYFLYNRLAA